MRAVGLAGAFALIIALVGTRFAIQWFSKHGFGQPIRKDGPTTHLVKRGVPTMGGVVIVVGSTVAYLAATYIFGDGPSASAWLLIMLYLGCALIGFLDDFIKVYQQDNRGLPGRYKIVGQTVLALAFGILGTQFFADTRGVTPASQYISTTKDWGIKLPLVIVLLVIWFIVTATSNATNLTDGADGLLTGSAALVFAAYAFINLWQHFNLCGAPDAVAAQCYTVRDPLDLAVFSAAIAGACAGFLWWNAKPAKIIMGDVGSLALGGALAGLAIMSRTELLMIIIGGLFVLETVSVMLQVTWFKLSRKLTGTPKRLFRITPIHHHFEHLGWDEVNVVMRFWVIAGSCVIFGLGLFYAAWLI